MSDEVVAYLPVPRAAWDFIAEAMEDAGLESHCVVMIGGVTTVALDLTNISLVPGDDRDQFVNANRIVDLIYCAGEEAFSEGYTAAEQGVPHAKAWDDYEPSDSIHDLQNSL